MKISADYHTHTKWSHASGSVLENVLAARARGLAEIGIAEHGPSLFFVGVPHRHWQGLAQEIREVSREVEDIKVLFNIEANIVSLAGKLDIPGNLPRRPDMILAGLHPRVLPRDLRSTWALYGLRWLALISRGRRHQLVDAFTEAVVNCVNNNQVDIVVHPGYGFPIDTTELALACARRGTLLEINCRHLQQCRKDIKIAAQVPDVGFVLGSDAHKPKEVGRLEDGVIFAKALGISPERIRNLH
jgi:putative hydrolase